MFYQFNDEPEIISLDQLNSSILTVGFVGISELEAIYKNMGFFASSVEKCRQSGGIFLSGTDIFDSYTFVKIAIGNSDRENDSIALFIKKNLLLMVDTSSGNTVCRDYIMKLQSNSDWDNASLERIICGLLEAIVSTDNKELCEKEFLINELEEIVLNNEADKSFNLTLLNMKKELLHLKSFYEQLIDISDTLTENKNELFDENDLTAFSRFSERAKRLKENADILRDSVVHLWDSYQAYLDMKLNESMKVFTMMTTIFFPLTVIVGWYGMNFKYMPELSASWGYPFVIVFSICVIAALIIWFKIKKWI